jgi:ribosomal protein L32E
MEKMIQREVTFTNVKFANIQIVEGQAVAQNQEAVIAGNVDTEKATKILSKQHGLGVTVLSVEANTKRFQMPVSTFVELGEEITEK